MFPRIRCPACRKGLLTSVDPGEVRCRDCDARYPVAQDILDLLPGYAGERSIAQASMEWEPLVRIYESRLWRRNPIVAALSRISFENEYALISREARLQGHEDLLDLACGPGIYARRLGPALARGSVIGLDLSLPMLRYAARRAREERLENLTLIRGSAMELPFETDRLEAVICCGALHLFPDADRVLEEIQRVLKPGGRFAVAAFRHGEGRLGERRAEWRRRLYGLDSFTPDELAARFERAGLSEPRCLHSAGLWLIMSARKH